MTKANIQLIESIKSCTLCEASLPNPAKPILQFDTAARILIAGQAPGLKAHETGIPFDDPSGKRLRTWLGVSDKEFYNPKNFAIAPMGFCYPGTIKNGDLPPLKACAETWRKPLLASLPNIELTLVLGKYAQAYHLPQTKNLNLTELVKDWQNHWPQTLPLPHPSPRNNRWFKQNPWFETEVLPVLSERVRGILG